MQSSRPQMQQQARLRPISLVMLNLLILLVAIGAFNFALSLVNLTNRHAAIAHTYAGTKALVISISSLLMVVVAGILINRAIVRLRSMTDFPS